METFKHYIRNILISIDQFLNTLIGGDPDETLSSRFGKYSDRCKICSFICYILDLIDKRHCKRSIEDDEGKDELIKL